MRHARNTTGLHQLTKLNQDDFGAVNCERWDEHRATALDGLVDDGFKIVVDRCVLAVAIGGLD